MFGINYLTFVLWKNASILHRKMKACANIVTCRYFRFFFMLIRIGSKAQKYNLVCLDILRFREKTMPQIKKTADQIGTHSRGIGIMQKNLPQTSVLLPSPWASSELAEFSPPAESSPPVASPSAWLESSPPPDEEASAPSEPWAPSFFSSVLASSLSFPSDFLTGASESISLSLSGFLPSLS